MGYFCALFAYFEYVYLTLVCINTEKTLELQAFLGSIWEILSIIFNQSVDYKAPTI